MMSYKECQSRHKYGYVYKIYNDINDKLYIGVSTSPDLRFEKHKKSAESGSDTHLYRAMRKYGIDKFHMEIIEKVLRDDMYSREIYWINHYDSNYNGYNSTRGGEGGNTFTSKTEEEMKIISDKISRRLKGSNNGNKGQYVGSKNPMYGRHLTEDHKAKMSKKLKGRKKPEGMGAKVSAFQSGRPKNYYHPNKILYIYDKSNDSLVKSNARDVKYRFNIDNYIEVKSLTENKVLLDDKYLLLESQETIESINVTLKGE